MDIQDNVNGFSPAIIVQGGWFVKDDEVLYREVTQRAASVGYDCLANGGSAVDAVEKAVRVFEEHDDFNAGRGSCLNKSGDVECDAMIMDGHAMKTGAVISASHFRHPVTIARMIMDESPHCALTGDGALEFALSRKNFDEICAPTDLKGDNCAYQNSNLERNFATFTDLSRNIYKGGPINVPLIYEEFEEPVHTQGQPNMDTVSAVAIDRNGFLACANSSGGIPGKLKGRVSDASQVGCGAYANKFGAAAANGPGESIMTMTLAREAVYNMERGQSAQEAAENAVQRMIESANAGSGIITVSPAGDFGIAFSTTKAVWASVKNGTLQSGIRLGPDDCRGPKPL